MSVKLFILRHGEAEAGRKWSDFDRPLTSMGKETIHRVGQKLAGMERIDLVLSSSAKRTRETTANILSELTYDPEVRFDRGLYNASMRQVLDILNRVENQYTSMLLVGHNPAMSDLVSWLEGHGHVSLAPGQWIEMALTIEAWKEVTGGCGIIIDQ